MWVGTHPSLLFRETISALRGAGPWNFYTLRDGPRLAIEHTTNSDGGLLKNFKGEHLKFDLKFSVFTPITLGVVSVTSRNFTRRCGSTRGMDINFGRAAPTKFGRAKTSIIRRDFWQLSILIAIRAYLRNRSTERKSENCIFHYNPEMEPGLRVTGHRVSNLGPGRVGSRVKALTRILTRVFVQCSEKLLAKFNFYYPDALSWELIC